MARLFARILSRRMARILRKTRNLTKPNPSVSLKISQTRVHIFNLMKQDTRIASVWTREGSINFYWKDDNKLYDRDLYDGGQILNYSFACINQCCYRKE